jgi:AcrR family transcriptional regulator
MKRRRKTREHEPLSRERALEVAMALADAEGLEGLSMRKLATALGVEAMSLYHHVANKEDILNGMVDVVFSQMTLPDPASTDWKQNLRLRARSARQVLVRHPWAVSLLESRTNPGLATLKHHDAVLGCLRRAGLSLALTGHAYALLDAFVYGFVQQELSLPFQTPSEAHAVTDGIVQHLAPDQYPHLVEYATQRVLQPGYAFGDEFEFGLSLLLDALERCHLEERRAP